MPWAGVMPAKARHRRSKGSTLAPRQSGSQAQSSLGSKTRRASKHHCALHPPCENSPCPHSKKDEPEPSPADPEALTRGLELELITKRASWQKMRAQAQHVARAKSSFSLCGARRRTPGLFLFFNGDEPPGRGIAFRRKNRAQPLSETRLGIRLATFRGCATSGDVRRPASFGRSTDKLHDGFIADCSSRNQ